MHSFERLPNGNVLATMQATDVQNTGPGGLVEYADDGSIVRMAGAATPGLEHPHPCSMVILPDKDRVITSSARMVLPPWDDRRVLLDPGDAESRLWILRIDPQSGALTFDDGFRDRGSQRPGVSFDRELWLHGHTGPALPHGSVFAR